MILALSWFYVIEFASWIVGCEVETMVRAVLCMLVANEIVKEAIE